MERNSKEKGAGHDANHGPTPVFGVPQCCDEPIRSRSNLFHKTPESHSLNTLNRASSMSLPRDWGLRFIANALLLAELPRHIREIGCSYAYTDTDRTRSNFLGHWLSSLSRRMHVLVAHEASMPPGALRREENCA